MLTQYLLSLPATIKTVPRALLNMLKQTRLMFCILQGAQSASVTQGSEYESTCLEEFWIWEGSKDVSRNT